MIYLSVLLQLSFGCFLSHTLKTAEARTLKRKLGRRGGSSETLRKQRSLDIQSSGDLAWFKHRILYPFRSSILWIQYFPYITCLPPTNQSFKNIQLHLANVTLLSHLCVFVFAAPFVSRETFLYLTSIWQIITYLSRLTRNAIFFFQTFLNSLWFFEIPSYDLPPLLCIIRFCFLVKSSRNFAFMSGILSCSTLNSPKDYHPMLH